MGERAHAWRSGRIEFRPLQSKCPEGALPLPPVLRTRIEAKARHSYDGKTLLVPGIPEAESDTEALDALERFCDRLRGGA
ncbi:MAG: host nuclease inhibitor protein [Rhodospirillaceae bacterium]|nr:host nuclease inhibitor protein [Rhodospirillaceae bacterium]